MTPYEDQLYGNKAAHGAFVLIKDPEWRRRLARYAALLPELQRGLPAPEAYQRESPGADSDLSACDVVYYAGGPTRARHQEHDRRSGVRDALKEQASAGGGEG